MLKIVGRNRSNFDESKNFDNWVEHSITQRRVNFLEKFRLTEIIPIADLVEATFRTIFTDDRGK